MQLDGLNSSHPISQEVEEAADIDRVFDWIAYKKVSPLRLFVPSKVWTIKPFFICKPLKMCNLRKLRLLKVMKLFLWIVIA